LIGRLVIPALAAVACGGAPALPSNTSHASVSERCSMVEAAFQLDMLKKFACGTAATRDHRTLVEVDMAPPFTETCSSNAFAIYKPGEPANTDAVLRLSIGFRGGGIWGFTAAYFDPPNSPNDAPRADGGFDDVEYYCFLAGGRLARTNGVWRSWDDPNW
jgi:hypothetical protein